MGRSHVRNSNSFYTVLDTYQTALGLLERGYNKSADFLWQVIYMAGWSPDVSQQRPKRRGTATVSFDDLQNAFPPGAASQPPTDQPSDDSKKPSVNKSITELASESKERERTGESEQGEGGTTTRLPSGTWFKID